MPQLVSLVQTLALELRRTTAELLFLAPDEPLPPVDLGRAHDRPNETSAGYTFLADPLNTAFDHAHPDCRTPSLSARIARTAALRATWFRSDGRPR